jgi:hypothetical protein
MFLGIFYLVSYMGVVGVDAGQGVGPTWSETPTWTVLLPISPSHGGKYSYLGTLVL